MDCCTAEMFGGYECGLNSLATNETMEEVKDRATTLTHI